LNRSLLISHCPRTVLVQSFLSVVGLVATKRPNRALLWFLFTLLILATGAIAVRRIVYRRTVRATQPEIVKVVTPGPNSIDDIYEDLRPEHRPLVNEALSRCLEDGTVEQMLRELRMDNGRYTKVRLYYHP